MEFDPTMLTWEKKKIEDAFGAFHDGINNSTGIQKIEHEAVEFPKEVADAIAENQPHYDYFNPIIFKL